MAKPPKSWFFGRVVDGKIVHADIPKLKHHLKRMEGMEVRIQIEKKPKQRRIRSTEQNGYYWAEPIAVLADHTGHTEQEIHDSLKAMFLTEEVDINGHKFNVVKSTTSLNTVEFEEYMQKIRMWASIDLGVYIRLPNEVGYDFELGAQ